MTDSEKYLSKLTTAEQAEFERIRSIVLETAPEATESFSYGMPAFKYKDRPLLYFGAFKSHLSIFPTSGPVGDLAESLKDFKTSKGTLQFTLDKPIPDNLLKDLVLHRIGSIDAK